MPSRRQAPRCSPRRAALPALCGSSLQPSTAGVSIVLRALYPARISVSSSLLAATMNQKSSLREDPQLVSGVLTGNNKILCKTNDKVAKDFERDRNVPLDPLPIFERKHYRHCDDAPCKSEHGLRSPLRSLPLSISKGVFGAHGIAKGHRNAATADYLPNGPVPEALRSMRLWIRWPSMRTVST